MDSQAKKDQKDVYLEVISSPQLEGQVIKKRYMIMHALDKGSFGTIYECVDLNKPDSVFVMKVSDNYQMLGREIEALKSIKAIIKQQKIQYPYDFVPLISGKGMFIFDKDGSGDQNQSMQVENQQDKNFLSYYVMPKYGKNLE